MISCYNKEGIGDTLIIMTGNSTFAEQKFESKGSVTRIFKSETNETVGFNFFNVSDIFGVTGNGQVNLTSKEVSLLNE